MPKENKIFVNCEICGASVRDINLALHMLKSHGIAKIGDKVEKIDLASPSDEERRELSKSCYSQAQEFANLKKYKEAIAAIQRALEYDQKNVDAHILLIQLLKMQHQPSTAIENALEKARSIAPDNPELLCEEADYLSSQRKHAEAINLLKNAKNYSENAEIVGLLVNEMMVVGKMADAKKELINAMPKLIESAKAGKIDREQYIHLGSVLYSLLVADWNEIRRENENNVFITIVEPFCRRCEENIIMEVTRVFEKNGAPAMEMRCEKCGDVIEVSSVDRPYSLDMLDRIEIEKSKNPAVVSLEITELNKDHAIIQIKFKLYGKEFFTSLPYKVGDSEPLQLLTEHLIAASRHSLASMTDEETARLDFILRNSDYEKKKIEEYFKELEKNIENFEKYAEEGQLLARTERLDFSSEELDTREKNLVERIGVYRRLAILSTVNGAPESRGYYLDIEQRILQFIQTYKTGYETATIEELMSELSKYENKEVPIDLLLEISKRKDYSQRLLDIVRDRRNWNIGVWRVATCAMYLIGAIGDREILPNFLSTISELDNEELLGDMVTEDLSGILVNFGRDAIAALIAAYSNKSYNQHVRAAIGDALAVLALLYQEERTVVINVFRAVVAEDNDPLIVTYAIIDLCLLQDKESMQMIDSAYNTKRVEESIIWKEEIMEMIERPDIELDCFRHCRHPLELVMYAI